MTAGRTKPENQPQEEIMNRVSRRVLVLVVGAATLSAVRWSIAATFNISDGDVAGLISAINTSNLNNEADTIILASGGNYVLTSVDNNTLFDGPNGLPVIRRDNAHPLVISGNGSRIARDANAPNFRIFSFANNGAPDGGVYISNLIIENGSLTSGSGDSGAGGGIFNSTMPLTLFNCTIRGNHSQNGGGIKNEAAITYFDRCTLTGNSAAFGGAISNDSYSTDTGTFFSKVTLTNCTLAGNSGTFGAAVYTSSSFSSSADARAIFNSCTLQGNGINNHASSSARSETDIENCILSQSPLSNDTSNGGNGGLFSAGYNLSSDNGGGFLTQPTDQINTDPGLDLAGLQDNTGPTQTIALTAGSAAIDKGKSFGLTTDQRGAVRPYDDPGIPNASGGDGSDIGAYEAPNDPIRMVQVWRSPITPITTTAPAPVGDCTLREAIHRANTVPGSNTIGFTHTGGTTTLILGELAVTDSVTINGNGNVSVSGNGASRVFDFHRWQQSLSGLTIRDGRNQIFLGNFNNGGGIYNGATLYVYGCSFINNHVLGANTLSPSAADGGAGQGGGIYNSGTLFLDTSSFVQTNQASGGNGGNGNFGHGGVPSGSGGAGRGGAVFNDASGSLIITNCTFNGNVALGGNGGSGGPSGGNGGNGDGGAIYNLGAMTITSATISGNTGASGTPGTGTVNGMFGVGIGGLCVASGTATVANTISAENPGSNGGGGDANGVFVSSGYNLIGNGDFSTGFNASGDQVGTTAAPINPQLGPLQNNGGGTDTMALLANSPAIDQGKSFDLATDQRGHERPFDAANISNASGGDGSDIGAFELGGTLVPINAVSRQTHGAAGAFDIPLPLTNSVGVECRSGGATGDYQIVLTFAAPVTVTGNPQAQITSGIGQIGTGGTSNGGVVSVNGAIVTVPLTNVANAQRITLTLFGASDGANTNNVTCRWASCWATPTATVLSTRATPRKRAAAPVRRTNATNFRSDVNADGLINSGDTTVVRAKSGTSLP